jgi:VWFA-related protein
VRRVSVPLALVAMLTATAAASVQQTVFRAGTEVVLVPVSVTQGRNPVAGLTAADFALLDNGVEQAIDAVSMATQPIDVTVILGTAPWTERDRLIRSGDSAERLHEMLAPDDRIRVVNAGERVRERVETRSAGGALLADRTIRPTRGSSTLDALFYAMTVPVDPDRRHLMVFFTDGRDTWSTLEPRQMAPLVSRADAVIHVVFHDDPPAPDTPRLTWNDPEPGRWRASVQALRDAARRTGGETHRLEDRAAAFRRIVDDFKSSYLLRYTPTGVDAPGWHEIAVKVTRPGRFTVRARSGYQRQ